MKGREARPAPTAWNVAKTLLQTLVFWGFFFAFLPWLIWEVESASGWDRYRFHSGAVRVIGAALFVCGGACAVYCGIVLASFGRGTPLPADCPKQLVTVGPYGFVRNPMVIGNIIQGVGLGLVLGSPFVVAYAVLGGPFWHYLVRPWEEADMESRLGRPYLDYRGAVRCWIPRRKPFRHTIE